MQNLTVTISQCKTNDLVGSYKTSGNGLVQSFQLKECQSLWVNCETGFWKCWTAFLERGKYVRWIELTHELLKREDCRLAGWPFNRNWPLAYIACLGQQKNRHGISLLEVRCGQVLWTCKNVAGILCLPPGYRHEQHDLLGRCATKVGCKRLAMFGYKNEELLKAGKSHSQKWKILEGNSFEIARTRTRFWHTK